MNPKTEELLQRVFKFGIDVLNFLLILPKNKVYDIITFQLAKASTSSGANYEEAQAAESTRDFVHKVGIVLKEIRESNYWLRVLNAIPPHNSSNVELKRLLNESVELRKIFTTIKMKAQKK